MPVFLSGITGICPIWGNSPQVAFDGVMPNPQHLSDLPLRQAVGGEFPHRLPTVPNAQADVPIRTSMEAQSWPATARVNRSVRSSHAYTALVIWHPPQKNR
jgi:hypothetical protein